jgi:hypothetical protein
VYARSNVTLFLVTSDRDKMLLNFEYNQVPKNKHATNPQLVAAKRRKGKGVTVVYPVILILLFNVNITV